MATRRGHKPTRRIAGDVYDAILELAEPPFHWNAGQIREELERRKERRELSGRVPDPRTIRGIIRNDVTPSGNDVWNFSETEVDVHTPEAARLILEVMDHLHEEFMSHSPQEIYDHGVPEELEGVFPGDFGIPARLTRQQAEWIVRLRQTYPEMPLKVVWSLTRSYIRLIAEGKPTKRKEYFIAAEVWRSGLPKLKAEDPNGDADDE